MVQPNRRVFDDAFVTMHFGFLSKRGIFFIKRLSFDDVIVSFHWVGRPQRGAQIEPLSGSCDDIICCPMLQLLPSNRRVIYSSVPSIQSLLRDLQIEGVPLLGCDADQVVSEFRIREQTSIFQMISYDFDIIELIREVLTRPCGQLWPKLEAQTTKTRFA